MPLSYALQGLTPSNPVSQFCHLPSFLDAAQLERWRATLDVAVARRARRMPLASDADNTNSPMYTQRCGLRLNDAELNRLTFAAGAVAGSAACTLNDHPAGFRLYLDNVLIKEPWGDPTRWHVGKCSRSLCVFFRSSKQRLHRRQDVGRLQDGHAAQRHVRRRPL